MSMWADLKDRFRSEERCVETSCKDDDAIAQAAAETAGKQYPPSRSQIGRVAWRYLHTMAANVEPATNNLHSESNLRSWLISFVQFYPCRHCAESFVDILATRNPDFSSAEAYSKWWVWAHNGVRKDLSQEIMVKESDLGVYMEQHRKGIVV